MPAGLHALHAWHGIGLIEHGLARQDPDLSAHALPRPMGRVGVRDGHH
jgi:hypothetical protein